MEKHHARMGKTLQHVVYMTEYEWHCIQLRARKRRLDQAMREALWLGGLSPEQVANELDVDVIWVYRFIQREHQDHVNARR